MLYSFAAFFLKNVFIIFELIEIFCKKVKHKITTSNTIFTN